MCLTDFDSIKKLKIDEIPYGNKCKCSSGKFVTVHLLTTLI